MTPVPNALFDRLLPALKDTELRVLLVVLRSTAGWTTGTSTERKGRDWISSAQMRRRTGRASEAVSAAIAALVDGGLLVVENREGGILRSAEERRRHLGRQFYRLGDGAGLWTTLGKTTPLCQPGKPKTTK